MSNIMQCWKSRNHESNELKNKACNKVEYQLLYRVLTLIAVVVWMAVIFFFSAQTGEESNQVASDLWIRKAAHMCEYAILAGLVWLHLQSYQKLRLGFWEEKRHAEKKHEEKQYNKSNGDVKKYHIVHISTALSAWVIAVCYAASDEIHQLYVPGRAGMVTDVCIDAAGALIGVCVVTGLWLLLCRRGNFTHKYYPNE